MVMFAKDSGIRQPATFGGRERRWGGSFPIPVVGRYHVASSLGPNLVNVGRFGQALNWDDLTFAIGEVSCETAVC
jgi:hypothetical protein